jgi:acyl carrier protein
MGNQFSIPLPTERRGQEITQPTLNHQRFLNNLELNLSQFSEHQNQLLQLHQQQLNLQISYTQIFAQLMQQQYALLTGADAASNPAVPPEVLDTLERSMMHFHNHMGETLRSHEQYLDYQAEYTQTFYHLTQQQYTLMATGDLTVPPTPLAQPTPYTPNSTPSMNNGVHASEIPVSTANIGVITQPAPISTPTTSLTSAPEADTQSATTEDQDTLTQALLEIVSQKTGYPSEMLEPRMELEADLSIDSIQQIEILAALQQGFPDLPRVQPADLAHLRTLEQIAAHFHDQKIKAKKNCLMPLSVNNPA